MNAKEATEIVKIGQTKDDNYTLMKAQGYLLALEGPEFTSLKTRYAELEEQTAGTMRKYLECKDQSVKLVELIRWVAQTIHQAHHLDENGTFLECPKHTCDAATQALKLFGEGKE